MPELISQEFSVHGYHVSLSYKNGDLVDVTVQEKDGTVLFTGWPKHLEVLANIHTYLVSTKTEG